jgi:hypothetical protein
MLKSAFSEVNELGRKKSDEASDEQKVGRSGRPAATIHDIVDLN